MSETSKSSISLETILEEVFGICFTSNKCNGDYKSTLDKLFHLARKILTFDNVVLYRQEDNSGNLEVDYARAMGRGRSAGAEIVWGESTAKQVLTAGQTILQQPSETFSQDDRLNYPHLLGIPIKHGNKILGALIFIRYGGPVYTPEHIKMAEFLVSQVNHIIEHNRLEKEIVHLTDEQKTALLQENFISTITHELLTPIGFIKGYTTTLLRSDTTWTRANQREFLMIIDEETDRLQELIDNMLDSARLQSGTLPMEFQPIRLDTILRDVIMRARMQHKSFEVTLYVDTPVAPINADPKRLAQVFENILNNALKYAPSSPVAITLDKTADLVHIAIQDNGPGIAPKHLPNLFERFYRIPDQSQNVRGTGLGLYICRQIIQAHNGEITVESQMDEGTTFHIYLPFNQTMNIPNTNKSL